MDTVNELTQLESNVEMSAKILDGVIIEATENEESLIELIELERSLRAKINEANEKIRAKRVRRAELAHEEKLAKQAHNADEVKLKQYRDQTSKESNKLENFKLMTEYAHAQNFAWTELAYPHQWQGALQLAHYGSGLLADTMGLGKTMQSIMYLDLLSCGDNYGAKRVLIICPDGMVSNYVDELKSFAPHRKNIVPLTGATATGRGFAKMAVERLDEFVIVSNYDAVRNNDMAWLADHSLDAVIIDEAHNINNLKGSTYESIRALKSANYLPITATFILNKPQDIFASLNLVLPGIFDDIDKFLHTYCQRGFDNKWTFKEGGEKALMMNLGGRIVRREYKEAGIVLPEMVKQDVVIPMEHMSEEQFNVYQQITEYSEVALNNEHSVAIESIIALITRQRQALCFPAGITIKVTETMYNRLSEAGIGCEPVGTVLLQIPESVPSIKIDVASDRITKAVKNGHRTVVFSQFKTALKGLEKSLKSKGLRVARYDGETKKDLAHKIKADFRRKPQGAEYEYDVVLVNYKSGGVGLTFTASTYMLKLDEEWNPGKNDQAEARIHRIGQTEKVLVETLLIDSQNKAIGNMGSVDKWMRELNEIKGAMIGGFQNELSEVNLKDSYRSFLASDVKKETTATKKPNKPKPEIDLDLLDF